MHTDFRIMSREGWKFTYKGSHLLPFAKDRYTEYKKLELEKRNEMAELLKDENQSISRMEGLNKKVEELGRLSELCAVFQHEFNRTPDREFHLAIGDVVFFGLLNQ